MVALSTSDNPYSPITQYDEWESYDTLHGYNTAAYLARVVMVSPELSNEDQNFAIESAIDEIVGENLIGKATNNAVYYIKVKGEEK